MGGNKGSAMTCHQIRRRLQDYVLGEMSQRERLLVSQHLRLCEKCQREEQVTRLLVALLDENTVEHPSADFVQSVMAKLPERAPSLSLWPLFVSLTLAIAGVFGVGYVFRGELLRLAQKSQALAAHVLSRMNLEALATNLAPRMDLLYYLVSGVACLLLTLTIIWVATYCREPLSYTMRHR